MLNQGFHLVYPTPISTVEHFSQHIVKLRLEAQRTSWKYFLQILRQLTDFGKKHKQFRKKQLENKKG